MTPEERELQIHPIVQDSVGHNIRTISNIRSLTSSLFGIAAGALGLESYPGFAFYLFGSLLVSFLIWALRADGLKPAAAAGKQSSSTAKVVGGPRAFFYKPVSELWVGDLMGGLSGFVLGWTLVYGLVRA